MTLRSIILFLTFYSLIISLKSCRTSTNKSFIVRKLDKTIKPIRISISDLAENYKKFQGQYIETTGTFQHGFEEFAIYPDTTLFTGPSKGFWLDINRDLNLDRSYFEKIDGKRVRIKGIIDTTSKGHMGSYWATIDKIYFWEEQ